jgi:hypothetical protein
MFMRMITMIVSCLFLIQATVAIVMKDNGRIDLMGQTGER